MPFMPLAWEPVGVTFEVAEGTYAENPPEITIDRFSGQSHISSLPVKPGSILCSPPPADPEPWVQTHWSPVRNL